MSALSKIVGKRLTYSELTGKEGEARLLILFAGSVAGSRSLRFRPALRLCARSAFSSASIRFTSALGARMIARIAFSKFVYSADSLGLDFMRPS